MIKIEEPEPIWKKYNLNDEMEYLKKRNLSLAELKSTIQSYREIDKYDEETRYNILLCRILYLFNFQSLVKIEVVGVARSALQTHC